MSIRYHTDGSGFKLPAKGRTARWIRGCVESEGRARAASGGENLRLGAVNFIFCGPERHLEINRKFLGHDYATDVITFDYGAEAGVTPRKKPSAGLGRKAKRVVSGDIFIDPETVAENARELAVAPAAEMRRVMVHGVLHLCGYGDKTRKEQKTMRAKEDFYLAKYYAIEA